MFSFSVLVFHAFTGQGSFPFHSQDLKLVHLTVYMMIHYLNFLKDLLTLTSCTPLDVQNPDHKIHLKWRGFSSAFTSLVLHENRIRSNSVLTSMFYGLQLHLAIFNIQTLQLLIEDTVFMVWWINCRWVVRYFF
jgi:hypothetical protein